MIIVCVRTRDESHRIGKFCQAYKDADLILVADGGSKDDTVSKASTYPNVRVRYYNKRDQLKNGLWRNNDSDHANFLFRWAYAYKPDWVIFDDCDIRPNYLLRTQYRSILENTDKDVIMAVRVYLWGKCEYFPQMSSPLGEEKGQGSLWAWRGNLDLWTVDVPPHFTFRIGNKPVEDFREDTNCMELLYPYCLLHYSWDDPERTKRKINFYRESGSIPNMRHPLEMGGKRKPLEEWMREE